MNPLMAFLGRQAAQANPPAASPAAPAAPAAPRKPPALSQRRPIAGPQDLAAAHQQAAQTPSNSQNPHRYGRHVGS